MTKEPFVLERVLNAPVSRVWRAITDRDQMKEWYFDIAQFKPEPGFEFQFTGGDDHTQYVHLCRILEVVPEKKLSYSWKYEGYPGESILTFELTPQGEKTKLKLTHAGLETFASDKDKNFSKESFAAGWNDIINVSLTKFAEKPIPA